MWTVAFIFESAVDCCSHFSESVDHCSHFEPVTGQLLSYLVCYWTIALILNVSGVCVLLSV